MLCVIISRRSSKRSRPNLVNDSVYERAGNNSILNITDILNIFMQLTMKIIIREGVDGPLRLMNNAVIYYHYRLTVVMAVTSSDRPIII